MLKIRYIYIMCACLLIQGAVCSQETDDYRAPEGVKELTEEEKKAKEKKTPSEDFLANRYFTGGNMGLLFGSITYVNLAPTIGYRVTERFNIGLSATYMYFRQTTYGQVYQDNMYGASAFSQYIILPTVMAHFEMEALNLAYGTERVWAKGVLIGAGYRQQMSSRAYFNMLLLLNLLNDPYYPYGNPIFRAGINIGI